jgi:hypothetical protein
MGWREGGGGGGEGKGHDQVLASASEAPRIRREETPRAGGGQSSRAARR